MTRWIPVLLLATTTGCCCVVPRTHVTQPAATFTVTDVAGQPLPDCEVALHHWSNPHHMWHSTSTFTTDAVGVVEIDEVTEQEMIMPLMIHGVPEYNFTWGIACAGHDTQVGSFQYVEPGDTMTVQAAMQPGTPSAVDDFDQFPASYTQWPLGADGNTGGPAGVTPTPAGDDDSAS